MAVAAITAGQAVALVPARPMRIGVVVPAAVVTGLMMGVGGIAFRPAMARAGPGRRGGGQRQTEG